MQTASSVQFTVESQERSAAMLHQKQLFEKFWKGTFKAVAMPRPESVIVASIIARTRLTRPAAKADQTSGDNQTDENLADSKPGDVAYIDQRKESAVDCTVPPLDGKKNRRHGRRHHHHRRHRRHCRAVSVSFDEGSSPWPKAKKKKKKLQRKRQRRRSHSCSLSPLKKKKKKKKSSKKSKRHRYSHKKSKHGSSTFKHERRNERKRKKSSGTGSRRKRRRRRSTSEGSYLSHPEDRYPACKSRSREMLEAKRTTANVSKLVKTTSFLASASTCSSKLFQRRASKQGDRSHDCDSGNDTSSPSSSKTGAADRSDLPPRRPTSLPFPDKDGVSDSGNSLTSYASFGKPGDEDGLSAATLLKRGHGALGSRLFVARSPQKSSSGRLSSRWHHRRRRSRSSENSRHPERPSSSLSSVSSYSRSPSYSPDLKWGRGSLSSVSSRGSYSRYRYRRSQKRTSSSSETDAEHTVSRKRRRYRSYSPMRKRRRDSPSHLEARRITSARKRPVPYFRRSPSTTSWSSLFSRCRSGSPAPSFSPSSSCWSFTRDSPWRFGGRHRSGNRY
ncbi:serine/arginine repetitive matrix protein 4 [Corythoichthys intestinalis]|uniref:serine/arginine repetitive matrix protein 4 n=1 Tax=Corythoichthys intestinalis TaxID=161448 RepID=UPI0025A53FA9|nr:serine/arginine repetitive matrix protein 4 [Corythoichthys intestinalis]